MEPSLSTTDIVILSRSHEVQRKALHYQRFYLSFALKVFVLWQFLTQNGTALQKYPNLNLSLALIVFADDMNIFTSPRCITAWLDLLSIWGSLSGVILNIPKKSFELLVLYKCRKCSCFGEFATQSLLLSIQVCWNIQ